MRPLAQCINYTLNQTMPYESLRRFLEQRMEDI